MTRLQTRHRRLGIAGALVFIPLDIIIIIVIIIIES